MRRECRERFPPAANFKANRYLAIPACTTARAWRTCRDACRDRLPAVTGKTFPAHAHPQFCVSGKRPIGSAVIVPMLFDTVKFLALYCLVPCNYWPCFVQYRTVVDSAVMSTYWPCSVQYRTIIDPVVCNIFLFFCCFNTKSTYSYWHCGDPYRAVTCIDQVMFVQYRACNDPVVFHTVQLLAL